MDILHFLLSNPAMSGPLVTLAVGLIKKELEKVDALPTNAKAVPVIHTIVMVCSFLVLVGDKYMNHSLHEIDLQAVWNFININLVAIAGHRLMKDYSKNGS